MLAVIAFVPRPQLQLVTYVWKYAGSLQILCVEACETQV